MCITESLHSTAETNKIVNQLDSSKKNLFLERLTGRENPLPSVTLAHASAGRAVYSHKEGPGSILRAPPRRT